MVDYVKARATSLRMLTKSSQAITRRAYTVGSYDPATGETTRTSADTTRYGALFNFGNGVTNVRGNSVQVSDKQLLVDGEATISMQDHFIVNGSEYEIISIDEINPAGTRVMYDLHVRGVS